MSISIAHQNIHHTINLAEIKLIGQVSETKMHTFRFVLVFSWLILIFWSMIIPSAVLIVFVIDFSQALEGRSLEQLTVDELYVLAKVLPNATQQDRLQIYQGILQEALEEGRCQPAFALEALNPIRKKLGLSEQEHDTILSELSNEYPDLLYPGKSPYMITVDYRVRAGH